MKSYVGRSFCSKSAVDIHPKRHENVVLPTVESLARQRFAIAHAVVTLPFVAEFLQRQSATACTIQGVDHPNILFQCCHIRRQCSFICPGSLQPLASLSVGSRAKAVDCNIVQYDESCRTATYSRLQIAVRLS